MKIINNNDGTSTLVFENVIYTQDTKDPHIIDNKDVSHFKNLHKKGVRSAKNLFALLRSGANKQTGV